MSSSRILNALLRIAWTGKIREKPCGHLAHARDVTPSTDGCEECIQLGDKWVHLRMCLICGHVGCCSSSRHDHALQHFKTTGHPLIKPYKQRGMDWIWCYEDAALLSAD
ncbi:MAG: UBP-type zinc finger domain-containing protein [Anaerolineae bacterium]|nr:UBP-type zinc finger domain-containing protein [Anaerolineae bacterium]